MSALDTHRHRGRMAHHAGLAAEKRVAQDYERRGYSVVRDRWRGQSGEVDLILRGRSGLIFVEVKQSTNFQRAAESLSDRQIHRLCSAAEEYLAHEPQGSLTEVRFDVALIDGTGALQIVENAFGQP